MNRLTIAIAAYRVAPFLQACLDSVSAQTRKDFDLLMIDDGSPDDTGAILDRYRASHPETNVVHQKNAGISNVRNRMIEMCRTEYLWMIDGDDLIAPDSVERLLPALDGQREAVYFTFLFFGQKETRPLDGKVHDLSVEQLRALRYKNMFDDDEPLLRYINGNSSVMCAHLVRTLRENNVRFEPGRTVAGDMLFTADFLLHATRVAYLDASLYIYRVNEGSTSLRYHADLMEKSVQWLGLLDKLLRERYPDDTHMRSLFDARVIGTCRSSLQLDICHPDSPNGYAARRRRFRAMRAVPIVSEALKSCPESRMGRVDKVFLHLMRTGFFPALDALTRVIMRRRYRNYRANGGRKDA